MSGSEFIKGVIEPTGVPLQYLSQNEVSTVLSKYVRNTQDEPVFTYYDGDYSGDPEDVSLTTPADPLALRLIHIHLKINAIPEQAPKEYILESDVQIRNLKDNL